MEIWSIGFWVESWTGICISKLRIHSPILKFPSSLNSILLEKSTSASFLSTLSWLYANAPNRELPVLIWQP